MYKLQKGILSAQLSLSCSTFLTVLDCSIPNYGRRMCRSVKSWLLKICHTEGPHTLGQSYRGSPYPCDNGLLYRWSSYSCESSQLYRGYPFSQRDPHISGKLGTLGFPIFLGIYGPESPFFWKNGYPWSPF